jgi:hypothetical protein
MLRTSDEEMPFHVVVDFNTKSPLRLLPHFVSIKWQVRQFMETIISSMKSLDSMMIDTISS